MKGPLWTIAITLGLGGMVLVGGRAWLPGYVSDLERWRDEALHLPEGKAAEDLFTRAVDRGVIVWNEALKDLEIRPEFAKRAGRLGADKTLYDEFFLLGETGIILDHELERARRNTRIVSVRAQDPNCTRTCDRMPTWSVTDAQGAVAPSAQVQAMAQALAAAGVVSSRVDAPSPRSHFALARHKDPGYSDWTGWHAQEPFHLVGTGLADYGKVDIIGTIDHVPDGWAATFFCRDKSTAIKECALGTPTDLTDGVRLVNTDGQDRLAVTVTPSLTVGRERKPGTYYLTERVALVCPADDDGGQVVPCHPKWVPLTTPRRYASGPAALAASVDPTDPAPTSVSKETRAALKILGPWAQLDKSNRIVGSDFTEGSGAGPVIGDGWPRAGSMISALGDMPQRHSFALSLDPKVQGIVADVIRDASLGRSSPSFAGLGLGYPDGNPRLSVTILDLRDPSKTGAILGTAGLPVPPQGLSDWDMRAAGFDATSGLAPGPAAWTGRQWHHIPGSTWKVLTTLSLIDAMTSGQLDDATRSALDRAFKGLTAEEASELLGDDVLSGSQGICIPIAPGSWALGTDEANCPAGTHRQRPVKDSNAGGPLSYRPELSYGLKEALAKSSNIWFVAAYLRAEAGRLDRDADAILVQTARRLGLLERGALDAGRGLSLTPRDAAQIEAMDFPLDLRPLGAASFGQQVQAGPLILAQVAASIALGLDVRPSLVTPIPKARPLFQGAAAREYLRALQEGMEWVVQDDDISGLGAGTAEAAFRSRANAIKPSVYGKTGTAQRDATSDDRVSSFLGWMNGSDGKPAVAIGCSASLLRDANNRVPPLCAHISAEILSRLAAEGLVK